jgi:hypothetical protein
MAIYSFLIEDETIDYHLLLAQYTTPIVRKKQYPSVEWCEFLSPTT